jgi:hypothetical protein
MKKILPLLIICAFIFSCATKPTVETEKPYPGLEKKRDEINQPTGFLDLRWGEKENLFSKRECTFDVSNSKVFYELSAYKCFDMKSVEGVSGMEQRLMYYRDKFFMGTLIFHKAHVDNLTKNLHAKYGPPTKTYAPRELFNYNYNKIANWNIGNVLIIVKYNIHETRAELSYIYLPAATLVNYRLEQDNEELLFEE